MVSRHAHLVTARDVIIHPLVLARERAKATLRVEGLIVFLRVAVPRQVCFLLGLFSLSVFKQRLVLFLFCIELFEDLVIGAAREVGQGVRREGHPLFV